MFSLGATLYAAVEGRPPFGTGDPFATLIAVVHEAPRPLLQAGPLRPVVEGLLAKAPDSRLTISSARELLRPLVH
jgi:serine/threonine protein kinase